MFVPRVGQNNINVRHGSPESASYTQLPRGDFFLRSAYLDAHPSFKVGNICDITQ